MQKNKPFILRWLIFSYERFPPYTHIPLILIFFAANAVAASYITEIPLKLNLGTVLGFIVILLFFYHLRIFDEIKDLEIDKIIHPERPLARGFISVTHTEVMAFFIILIEITLTIFIGYKALIIYFLCLYYSLLMYKEFFIKKFLRNKLFLYSILHTPISCLIVLFIFTSVTDLYFFQTPVYFLLFLLISFLMSNIFEFGRKTFSKEEEKKELDSYSKKIGIPLISYLVLFLILTSLTAAAYFGWIYKFRIFYFTLLILFSLIYIFFVMIFSVLKTKLLAKIFRLISVFSLLIINLIILMGIIWSGR